MAGPLPVVNYLTTPGGSGSTGTLDFAYSPCFESGCDNLLSLQTGGVGEFVNGVPTATSWFAQGWGTQWIDRVNGLPDPIVTFDLGEPANLVLMTVWIANTNDLDNAEAPMQVPAGAYSFVPPVGASPSSPAGVSSAQDLIGRSVTVQFSPVPDAWVLRGGISFAGSDTLAIPEMATGLMVLGGILVGGCLRLKRVR